MRVPAEEFLRGLPEGLRRRMEEAARRRSGESPDPPGESTGDGLPRCRESSTEHGPALVRSKTLRRSASALRGLFSKLSAFEGVLAASPDAGEAGELASAGLEGAVFLDLETTGFSSTPLFLAGTMTVEGGSLEVRQFFAKDYSQEKSVLQLVTEFLRRYRALVTFNGKSYDLPFLRERCLFHGIPFRANPVHLDLLHPARRLWRDRLPNCRLVTLEWHLCGRQRVGDVHGAEIPAIYHEFVRSGRSSSMGLVFHHNLLDLVTLAELLCEIGLSCRTGTRSV